MQLKIDTKNQQSLKKIILKEFCSVCGYNRKYETRILNNYKKGKSKKTAGCKPLYSSELLFKALKNIWTATDYISSKRLKEEIPLWLPYYELTYRTISEDIKHKLKTISAATIDRLLKPVRLLSKKGLAGTKPCTKKIKFLFKPDNWDINKPGFIEADTVAYFGNSLYGDFIWSLTMTDIHTGWTENRAVWNKGSNGVLTQI